MKRWLLLGLCVVFSACQQKQKTIHSLLDYLPNNALLVVKSSSFNSLREYTKQHQAARAIGVVFPSFFEQLDKLPANTNGQLSYHPEGKDRLSYLWITYQKPFFADSVAADTLTYDKIQLYHLKTDPPIYYASWDSLHISSSSKILIESSIRLRTVANPVDASLSQLYNSATDDHTIFVQREIAPYFNTLFDNIEPLPWTEWNSWTACVPSVNEHGFYLRAYGLLDPAGSSRLSAIANQEQPLQQLGEHVPANAHTIHAFAYHHATFEKAARRFQAIHNKPESTIDSLFVNATQVAQVKLGENQVLIIKNEGEANDILAMLTRQAKAQYNTNGNTIFEFSDQHSKTDLFFSSSKKRKYAHAALFDNHIYLGDSKTGLESVLTDLEKEDVLAANSLFESYAKTLPKRSSIWSWAAPTYFETHIKKTVPAISKKEFKDFRQLDYVGVVEGDVFYITLSIQKPSDQATKIQSVERSGTAALDTSLIWGPYAVLNHQTQALEWVVQDEKNNLLLLDVSGRELWKKQLNGPILGDIQQVDIYRNKRLQLAFTTDKSFQVLDRNGNEVSGFTRQGMAPSSTFSLFDYDKQRDYRILLSSGNTLEMYNRQMKKVNGWQKSKLSTSLAYVPKHIRIGNRDYISLVYKSGKVELLHRTGKTRINIPNDVQLTQDIYPYKEGFVSLDNKNRLVEISTSGKITRKALPFETRYWLTANKNTLVTLTENKVTINNQLVELDFGVFAPPQIQIVNNKTYILIWDNQAGKIYVFNNDAILLDSFPVSGDRWAMLGQGAPGSAIYLATRNNKRELRFYRMP